MRALAAALAALTLFLLSALPASAHTPGAPPAGAQGSFVLTAAGTNNSSVHDFLSAFGLPIGPRDTLNFAFDVNEGRGPPIKFEIHTHGGLQGYTIYYNVTASSINATYYIDQNTSLMVWFENPWAYAVNVTYSFVLYAPAPDITPYLIIMAVAVGGAIGFMWWVRAGGIDFEEPPLVGTEPQAPPAPAQPSEQPPLKPS